MSRNTFEKDWTTVRNRYKATGKRYKFGQEDYSYKELPQSDLRSFNNTVLEITELAKQQKINPSEYKFLLKTLLSYYIDTYFSKTEEKLFYQVDHYVNKLERELSKIDDLIESVNEDYNG